MLGTEMSSSSTASSHPPRVFISYDSEAAGLKEAVHGLACRLREEGVDARADVFDLHPAEGWEHWREREITEADFVLVVCTQRYRQCFEDSGILGKGGRQIKWEAGFLRRRIYDDPGARVRVIPVWLPGASVSDIPGALRGSTSYALPEGYDELYRRITQQPRVLLAPLGELRRTIDNLGTRPPVFEGRKEELTLIRRALVLGPAAVHPAITGLGGIGKTRLALEHAFTNARDYDVRWRVRAGELASLQEDFVALGRQLGILSAPEHVVQSVQEVKTWLSTHARWFLLLDNAEGAEAIAGVLPSPCPGHVIITSRARAWRGIATTIEVDRLSPSAAWTVLSRRSGCRDDGNADALVEELGCLPLALVQAGAYMETTRCSFAHYRALLRQDGVDLFLDPKAAPRDGYPQTLARTWSLSMVRIRERSPAAAALLEWLAFLDPDGVPLRLLGVNRDGLPEALATCARSVRALDDAIAALVELSMVDRVERDGDALRVHRLVQAVTRDQLGEERRRQLAGAAARWVQGVFEYDAALETPIHRVPEGIAEQVLAVGMLHECVGSEGRTVSSMLGNLADYRLRRGMTDAAMIAGRRAVEVAEALSTAAPHDEQARHDLCVALGHLGLAQARAGNLDAARTGIQRALDSAEMLLKADPHGVRGLRDLSLALNRLGDVELQAGLLATARTLFQRSVHAAETLASLDPGDSDALRELSLSLDHLSNVEIQSGRFDDARALAQRSLHIAEALANADPQDARIRRNLSLALHHLGNVEFQAGNHATAHTIFQRHRELTELLAAADPHDAQARRDASMSLGYLGSIEAENGNLDRARVLFQRHLRATEMLAKTDPHSAQAQRDLSLALENLGHVELQAGNLAAARVHFERYLHVAEALAKADPHSARAAHDLVVAHTTFAQLGQQEGAFSVRTDHLRRANALLVAMADNGQLRDNAHYASTQRWVRDAIAALEAARASSSSRFVFRMYLPAPASVQPPLPSVSSAHDDESGMPVERVAKPADRVSTILLLAADGIDPARHIELEKEYDAILDALHHCDWLTAVIGPSSTLALVLGSLAKAPAVVHIGGRGHHHGELVFAGDDGTTQHLPPERVARLFRELDEPPSLVVFGTPGSMRLAAATARYVPYAVGFHERISDRRLLSFSTELYRQLSSFPTLDIPRAFALAKPLAGSEASLFEHSVTP